MSLGPAGEVFKGIRAGVVAVGVGVGVAESHSLEITLAGIHPD